MFISPDEARLRAAWRLFGQIGLLLVFLVLGGLLTFIARGIIAEMILSSLATLLAVTLSIYLARRLLDLRSFTSLGLRLDSFALRDVLFGIGIAGLMMGVIYLLEWAFGWLVFQGFAWQRQPANEVILAVLSMFVVFALGAWQEELFSRGYQMRNLAEGLNLPWGVVLSSAIFGLLHLGNPYASTRSTIGIFAAGLFLAFAYLRTGQLWLPIGLHVGWNFFEGTVFGFPVSGLGGFHLIQHGVDGPELITGGNFGPEAGLILLPGLVLGTLLIFLYSRPANQGNVNREAYFRAG